MSTGQAKEGPVTSIEEAIRSVLSALNLDRSDFGLTKLFSPRTLRDDAPVFAALSTGRGKVLCCFLGSMPSSSLEQAKHAAIDRAIELLSPVLRAECRGLVVAWEDLGGPAWAIAASMRSGDATLLACSWQEPHQWAAPSIDTSLPAEQSVDQALLRLQNLVKQVSANSLLSATISTIGIGLQRMGGVPISPGPLPRNDADAQSRLNWFERYSRSVRAELARTSQRSGAFSPIGVAEDGPLRGWKVFVSYAKPDAAVLAVPICEAIASLGGYGWLDQEQLLDRNRLDLGLSGEIATCDAYVMCASDEFIERAGYATQELAWAIERSESNGTDFPIVIAAAPGTVLPSQLNAWPRMEVSPDANRAGLGQQLLDVLRRWRLRAPMIAKAASSIDFESRPRVPSQADRMHLMQRVRHLELFDHLSDQEIREFPDDSDLESDLGWSGHLDSLAQGTDDTSVFDLRWRIGVLRILSRLDVSGARDPADVLEDVAIVLMKPSPQVDWIITLGWGDEERSAALRWHIGFLRVLSRDSEGAHRVEKLFSRFGNWRKHLIDRRIECLDRIVDLRRQGRLRWKSVRFWNEFHRATADALRRSADKWRPPLPGMLPLYLASNAIEIGAALADQLWAFDRYGESTGQRLGLVTPEGDIELEISVGAETPRSPKASALRPRLALSIQQTPTSAWLQLRWRGTVGDEGMAALEVDALHS